MRRICPVCRLGAGAVEHRGGDGAAHGPAARLYERGEEVEQDRGEAERWYAKAVEFGYSPAARNLAAAADPPSPLPATAPTAAPGERAPAPASTAPATAIDAADYAADVQVDIADGTLDLALTRLTGTPSDTEALRGLRQAAHALNPAASPAAASAEPPGEVMFVVHVTSLRAVPWKSYGAMRAAVAAYEKHQALAPDAVFRFAVMPPPGMTLPPNFALRVRSETGQEFPIRLEHGELFTLPPLPELDGKADLVSNFKGGPLRIGLLVHSQSGCQEPHVSAADRQHAMGQRCRDRVRLPGAAAAATPTVRSGDL